MSKPRVPRKAKKRLKKAYQKRYGFPWLSGCSSVANQYLWFFKNPLKYDMLEQIKSMNYAKSKV